MADPIISNAYAVAYRLIGDESAARVVARSAAARVRQRFHVEAETDMTGVPIDAWLPMLIDFTVEESVRRPAGDPHRSTGSDFNGLREALRRRLVRASRPERVIGALVHLCGYSPVDVAGMLNMDIEQVSASAKVIAPPPGINYRDLGDPHLVGSHETRPTPLTLLPRQSTIAVAALLLILLLLATRCTGPRPTLVDEGAWAANNNVLWTQPL